MRYLVPAGAAAGLLALALACVSGNPERRGGRPGPPVPPHPLSQPSRHRENPGDAADRAVADVRGHARQGRFDEAWNAIASLPQASRDEWAVNLSSMEAATDPCSAWERSVTAGEELRDACREAVIRNGSAAFLPQLADLAAGLPDSPRREEWLKAIVSRWAIQDLAGLTRWPALASMPAAVRDETALRVAVNGDSMNRDSETALAWANSISDPRLRQTAVEAVLRQAGGPSSHVLADPDAEEPVH